MSIQRLLHGEKVKLAALLPEDAQQMARWYSDGEFARLWDSSPANPRNPMQINRWFDEEGRSKEGFPFSIRLIENDTFIGYLSIDGILWTHQSGWLAIAIGEASQRGKGYGTEALRLALNFAFYELNLYRIQLTVFSYNTAAIRVYEKLGFTREGLYREALNRDGQRFDMLLYGMLRGEWERLNR